ncbi:MAG: transcriptional repressor LexA [Planctomycetes bacterium]|nr:transcriptional repressor LexA [Planctomycetota bacterium]
MNPSLTPKQLRVLRYFRDYRQENGMSPTLEEAAAEIGVSKITIREHLMQLQRKGAIKRDKARARAVTILYDPDESSESSEPTVRILGRIAAGTPIEAIEDPETVALTELVPADDDVYLLRVRGKSMIEDHIDDGDLVVVRRSDTARNGDVVVAICEDEEATLKRYYREGNRVRLQPANSEMDPIYPASLEIRGIVEGVIRRYR